jgi:exosortase A-associated hydrolase 2
VNVLAKGDIKPVFLDGSVGKLFAVYHPPSDIARSRGALVYVPPFAEEMNRSRRMAALQAQVFAAHGIAVLLLDLFGTGDSAGDFEDARWTTWLADIQAGADWLHAHDHVPVGLWGLRLGALLATIAAAHEPKRFQQLVLWQPVTSGKAMLSQFLRIRVAAGIGSSSEKTADLRAQWERGEPVEVAGYMVSSELALAIDAARLDTIHPASGTRVMWFEVAAGKSEHVLPAGESTIETWRRAGIIVDARTVAGDPFWALQETTLAPDLITATRDTFETWLT